jgi:uncharacterized protein (TIRG00374 family)
MRWIKAIALVIGLFLLVWIVRKLGVQALLDGFRVLGWKLLVPVVILFPCYLLYTLSWSLFLKKFNSHSIPFWTLFGIKVAGEAANTVTPLNFAGGDPVRILLLSKNFPAVIGGASVVVDRTLQTLAIISLIFVGNMVALFRLSLPGSVKMLLGGTAGLLFLVVLFFVFHQTRGLFEKIFNLGARFKIKFFSPEKREKFAELDDHLGVFYRGDKKLFVFCFFLHFAARLVGTLELIYIANALGIPMGPWEALFFAAVIPLTNLLSAVVPGNLGVLEGVVSSLFVALQWDPAKGVVLQIARRLRSFAWIVIGFVVLLFFRSDAKKELKKEAALKVS